jgi:hypothetical protein
MRFLILQLVLIAKPLLFELAPGRARCSDPKIVEVKVLRIQKVEGGYRYSKSFWFKRHLHNALKEPVPANFSSLLQSATKLKTAAV